MTSDRKLIRNFRKTKFTNSGYVTLFDDAFDSDSIDINNFILSRKNKINIVNVKTGPVNVGNISYIIKVESHGPFTFIEYSDNECYKFVIIDIDGNVLRSISSKLRYHRLETEDTLIKLIVKSNKHDSINELRLDDSSVLDTVYYLLTNAGCGNEYNFIIESLDYNDNIVYKDIEKFDVTNTNVDKIIMCDDKDSESISLYNISDIDTILVSPLSLNAAVLDFRINLLKRVKVEATSVKHINKIYDNREIKCKYEYRLVISNTSIGVNVIIRMRYSDNNDRVEYSDDIKEMISNLSRDNVISYEFM
ncbi:MAG: hypothetical protein IJ593_03365 [Lachnospiraceae bacterium]|nr:hypothetical protein [Lachnospiraceae bacterium]